MSHSSISVAVRVRPFTYAETQHLQPLSNEPLFLGDGSLASNADNNSSSTVRQAGKTLRKIVNVVDDKMLIFDPSENNPLTKVQRQVFSSQISIAKARIREHRFVFDRLFDQDASQEDVFCHTTKPLLDNVLDGYNASVFAYGATGCGKTHTISGTPEQPGLIFLTMKELFERIDSLQDTNVVDLSLSYLEIYNETIRDLLVPDCGKPLVLREDAEKRISVSNLSSHNPQNVEQVMDMILQGNNNRTMSPTDANAVSSRSHAVLQINVSQRSRTAELSQAHTFATLSIIDLAGSERASATKNRGERLIEGANINKSLLALGNCINALCDPRRRNHVPYRDSKLTRLLKFSLGGNCKTVMIVCISPSSQHYDETLNTLKYADRAKKIKTKITRNEHNLDRHVGSYLKMITEQRAEIEQLRKRETKVVEQAIAKEISKRTACIHALHEAQAGLDTTIEKTAESRENRAKCTARLRVLENKIMQIDVVLESINSHAPSYLLDQISSQATQIKNKLINEKTALQQLSQSIPDIQAVNSAITMLSRRLGEVSGWTEEDAAAFAQYCEMKKLQCETALLTSSVFEIPIEGSLQSVCDLLFQTMNRIDKLVMSAESDDTNSVIVEELSQILDDIATYSNENLLQANNNMPTSLDISSVIKDSATTTSLSLSSPLDTNNILSLSTPSSKFTPSLGGVGACNKPKRPSIPAKRSSVIMVRSPRRKVSKKVRWDDGKLDSDSPIPLSQSPQNTIRDVPDKENESSTVLQTLDPNSSDTSLESIPSGNSGTSSVKKFGVRGELKRKISAKRKFSALGVNYRGATGANRIEKENHLSPVTSPSVTLHLLSTASSAMKQSSKKFEDV